MNIPVATYRLQLRPEWGFRQAREVVPYLKRLGVSHLYLSPVWEAVPGSTHGYDVVNPTRLNPELGTEDEWKALVSEARAHGLGFLLDVVPNHMSVSPHNPWWWDVLENGPASRFAHFFDVDWEPSYSTVEHQVLLPVLGQHYGAALEAGELKLAFGERGLTLQYYVREFPIRSDSYALVLGALAAASPGTQLWQQSQTDTDFREQVEALVAQANGRSGDPASWNALDTLLRAQHYQLAFWRTAAEEINSRRFFDVSDLGGVRVEEPGVFEATHPLVLRFAQDGIADGLRVDHIDGLHDPLGYLRQLRAGAPDAYLVVEKILAPDEDLPREWPTEGTTGYDFLNQVNSLLVSRDGLRALDRVYADFVGLNAPFHDIGYAKKKFVIWELFAGEQRALERGLSRLAREDRHARDVAARELGIALVEVTACLAVYRTYVRAGDAIRPEDRARLEAALAEAERRNANVDPEAYRFLGRVLLLDLPPDAAAETRAAWLRWVTDWQQSTGPITAKGVEDTALYVYNRLMSLDDVGADPGEAELSVGEFHRTMQARQANAPVTMNASSTHDTKRSEDVRARLHVLSDLPERWGERLFRWHDLNRHHRPQVDGRPVPDRNEEVLIYQTLLGAWPFHPEEMPAFADRVVAYMTKAAREAKVHTMWTRTDEEYEAALGDFVRGLLGGGSDDPFLADLRAFHDTLAFHGALNGLAAQLLKIAAPGVPDFYQGSELWYLRLVDPDNRTPVDFGRRSALLDGLSAGQAEPELFAAELLEGWADGRLKLWLTQRALALRGELRGAFGPEGEYLPLHLSGEQRRHLCAFARRSGAEWALVVVPVGTARLREGQAPLGEAVWGDTRVHLPMGSPVQWVDLLAGTRLAARTVDDAEPTMRVADLFRSLPVALIRAVGA